MLVTLFTDASVIHSADGNHRGGWAFWAKSERGVRKGGGKFNYRIGSSNDAEMAAIVNAIHTIKRTPIFAPGDVLLITVDNVQALRVLSGRWPAKHETEVQILSKFNEIVGITEITFRHIKAHSGSDTPRTWVHSWCDRIAKTHARGGRL